MDRGELPWSSHGLYGVPMHPHGISSIMLEYSHAFHANPGIVPWDPLGDEWTASEFAYITWNPIRN